MDRTPKAFRCKASGCGIEFTNEDHLNVHMKKHDMILNLSLGSKTNVFTTDQTPTPTRLLRNCEEVGLFDDLRHVTVNPFDETFRRAVETKKSSHNDYNTSKNAEQFLSDAKERVGDDTLHTPHVFCHYNVCDTANSAPIPTTSSDCQVTPESPQLNLACNTKLKERLLRKASLIIENKTNSKPKTLPEIKLQSIKITKMDLSSAFSHSILPKNNDSDVGNRQIKILPKTIKQNTWTPKVIPLACTIIPTVVVPQTHVSQQFAKAQLQSIQFKSNTFENTTSLITKHNKVTKIQTIHATKSSTNRKSFDASERKRAAAKRYRIKFRSVHDQLQQQNSQLLADNAKMKKEISKLKSILLAHKNCSIFQSMADSGNNSPYILITPPTDSVQKPYLRKIRPVITTEESGSDATNDSLS